VDGTATRRERTATGATVRFTLAVLRVLALATGELLELVKALAGPTATVIAASIAAWVAYTFGKAQSETARSQRDIAFDKLKVDLFDRRYLHSGP
jgi:hypothetical protein